MTEKPHPSLPPGPHGWIWEDLPEVTQLAITRETGVIRFGYTFCPGRSIPRENYLSMARALVEELVARALQAAGGSPPPAHEETRRLCPVHLGAAENLEGPDYFGWWHCTVCGSSFPPWTFEGGGPL